MIYEGPKTLQVICRTVLVEIQERGCEFSVGMKHDRTKQLHASCKRHKKLTIITAIVAICKCSRCNYVDLEDACMYALNCKFERVYPPTHTSPLTQLPNCFCLPPVHWPGLNLPSPLTWGPVGRQSVGGAVPPALHKEYGFCHTTATGTGSPPTR